MNVDPSPLVSVVTPVYNGEKYLAECIESVLAQTYQNWEYVIVNNCSKDRTLEIARDYAQQDARIRVHNNTEFLNVLQNWNHALRQISPESNYCKVVHADDWLYPECIMEMVKVAEASPTVGIIGAYRLRGNRVKPAGLLPFHAPVISGREICRWALTTPEYIFGSPTTLLIRSDLIRARQAFYNESNLHADTEVCFDVLQNSDFGFVYQVLTCTRMHDESITSSFADRFNTYLLGWLTILTKYGPIYFCKEEYKQRLKWKIQQYYRLLGRNVLHRREKAFWDYHKAELKKLGYSFSWLRLLRGTFLALTDRLFRPGIKAA